MSKSKSQAIASKEEQVPEKLKEFRNLIDEIDNQIIELLNKRIKIIKQVGEYKKTLDKTFFVSSNREADMIRNLLTRTDSMLPKSVIINIWRKIIASANALEQQLKIAIHNPGKIADYLYLVREYYGDFIPVSIHDSSTNIISELEKQQIQIGVFALPDWKNQEKIEENTSENWWINLAHNNKVKVFARLPFMEYIDESLQPHSNLVAVAIKKPEKSRDDKTLIFIETPEQTSRLQIQNALKEAGLEGRLLKSVHLKTVKDINFHLLEVDGFFEEQDSKVAGFMSNKIKPYLKIIGHYPSPVKIA